MPWPGCLALISKPPDGFRKAIELLAAQGRADEARQLRDKIQGIVKLDAELMV